MDSIVIIGVIISGIGLIGILLCIYKAMQIRKQGGTPEETQPKFQKLVALNMGSLFLSMFGLIVVVLGIVL